MKRNGKFLATTLGLAITVFGCFSACNKQDYICPHEYTWYSVIAPTCTQKGANEGTCKRCGKKEYIVIEALGHTTDNGVCGVCGEEVKNGNVDFIPDEKPDGWSVSDLYERINILGWKYQNTQEFINDIKEEQQFSELRVGKLGLLYVTVNMEYSVALPNVRCDYEMELGETAYVNEIEIKKSELKITYVDGTIKNFGKIADFIGELEEEKYIMEIALNMQNEVLLVYTNGAVEKVGIIAEEQLFIDNSALKFSRLDGSWAVAGTFDRTITSVVIPETHRGQKITGIANDAFYNSDITSVVLPSQLKTIGSWAFGRCDNLTNIKLPKTVTSIGNYAFYGSERLTSIEFEGTKSEWNAISKGRLWSYSVKKVCCSDGEIIL